MKRRSVLLGLTLFCCQFILAEDQNLRVAVFPFESQVENPSLEVKQFIEKALKELRMGKDPKEIEKKSEQLTLGEKISELLTAQLSGNHGIELVERARIEKAFDELALGQTGLIEESQVARIGRMVGAHVLVTGKAFPLDNELFIVAKVIGVQTSHVFAAKANGSLSGQLSFMVYQLSDGVSKILHARRNYLMGDEVEKESIEGRLAKSMATLGDGSHERKEESVNKNPDETLKKSIYQFKLPHVSVYVSEKHMHRDATDSAVKTELIYLLQKSGFEITDERNRQISDWALAYLEDTTLSPPKSTRADVVIIGEAFSEFAARRGDLVSCKARVELRALDVRTGQVLAIERKTHTAVNIAENIAAKTALQEATQELSLKLIPTFTQGWNR